MLVVVKDWDVYLFVVDFFDDEVVGGFDVFQVDCIEVGF